MFIPSASLSSFDLVTSEIKDHNKFFMIWVFIISMIAFVFSFLMEELVIKKVIWPRYIKK